MISGTLDHDYDITCSACDGVQTWIVSSRTGPAGTWIVHRSSTETNVKNVAVKAGDTIDFVVSSYKVYDRDPFNWAVVIRKIEEPGAAAQSGKHYGKYQQTEWHSVADFRGPAVPRLDAWERYAQALLASVEFMFID